MSEFLFSYGLFIAKVVTGLIALVFVVVIIGSGRKKEDASELKVSNLNEKYKNLKNQLTQSILDKDAFKALNKKLAKESKKEKKQNTCVMLNL